MEPKQNKITFHVDDVEPGVNPMSKVNPNELSFIKKNVKAISHNAPIYDLGNHPVLKGYEMAFKNHLPIIISPDIIWTLILQGFAIHVNVNAERLRDTFVDFADKKELEIEREDLDFYNISNEQIQLLFPLIVNEIEKNIKNGKEFIGKVTADFSTSTPVTVAVSQLSVMSTFKKYFDYKVRIGGCGFPEITVEGTVEDWQKIIEKTKFLEKYELKWWVSEILPVLEKILDTKMGNIDLEFWRRMLRIRGDGSFYDKFRIDGWIVKFYPYDAEGGKMDMVSILEDLNDIKEERNNVPVKVKVIDGPEYNTSFDCGFIGVSEDPETLAIKPEIGWIWYIESE